MRLPTIIAMLCTAVAVRASPHLRSSSQRNDQGAGRRKEATPSLVGLEHKAVPSSANDSTQTTPRMTLLPGSSLANGLSGGKIIQTGLASSERVLQVDPTTPIYTVCNDVRDCFGGDDSVCVENPDEPESYFCDCDEFSGESTSFYVGHDCGYLYATSICNPDILTHFCTNDGECPEINGPFSCTCPEGYGGAHCQFYVGIEPSASPSEMPSQSNIGSGVDSGSEMPVGAPSVSVEPPAPAPTPPLAAGGTIPTSNDPETDPVCQLFSCNAVCLYMDEVYIEQCNCKCIASGALSNERSEEPPQAIPTSPTVMPTGNNDKAETDPTVCQVLGCNALCLNNQEDYIELCKCSCT